jgi:hypothetical protein
VHAAPESPLASPELAQWILLMYAALFWIAWADDSYMKCLLLVPGLPQAILDETSLRLQT